MTRTPPGAQVVNVRRRQQRSLETRQRLWDAAIVEFANCGYAGSSLRVIAQAADVDHNLITHHFGGKDALWRAIIDGGMAELEAVMRQSLLDDRNASARERLEGLHATFIRFLASHPHFPAIMSHARIAADTPDQIMQADRAVWIHRTLADLVRSVQADHGYVDGDPDHLVFAFIAVAARPQMLPVEFQRVLKKSPTDAEFIDEHIALCRRLFFRDVEKS